MHRPLFGWLYDMLQLHGLLVNLCYNSKAFKSIYVTTTKPPRVTVYRYVMIARPPQVY